MIPHNNYDKLSIVKLFIIIKVLQQQSCCNEKVNLISKEYSKNINHKNNLSLNNSSVKRNSKGKMNTVCKFPIDEANVEDDSKFIPSIQEVTIEDDTEYISFIQEINNEYDTKCIPSIQESNIEDAIKYISFIQEINYEYDTKCLKKNIKNKDEIRNNTITSNGIYEIPKNINIPIESTLKLKNDNLDIKNMKDHIYLISSKVLPMY